ncbi:MAG: TetR/AcrR family transcriptional regulator [Ruminococcus sp.]|nr:TetR/AcrR family transcriptional regulator [Ruminococcus sp.]
MDLRVKKTKKNIKEAFFQLRKRKPIEKISVKELSEIAMINKATFYLHYRDVYDLSDKLENELISVIIDSASRYDLRLGRAEFKLFADAITGEILDHSKEIEILFSGKDNNTFINHLEDRLKEYVFMTFPNIPNNGEVNIILTLFIQGSYRAYIRNPTINREVFISTSSSILMRLLNT